MNLKEIALDVVKLGRTHDEEATRFLKSNEQRLNENFRRLKEATEEIMADFSDYYPKSEVDTLLSAKADVITSYGDLSKTGATLSHAPSAVSVASSTWTTVSQLTLPVGRWVVFANARFNSNVTGYRDLILSDSADDGTQLAYIFHDTKNAVNGNHTYCSVSSYQNVTAQTTRYLNAYQNSGSALNVIGRMYAIRIC